MGRSGVVGPITAALLLLACLSGRAAGFAGAPTYLTDGSATVNGSVASTIGGPTGFWVEYGTSTEYGLSGARRERALAAREMEPVSAPIAGLQASTTYHYRLCARDAQEGTGPGCSADGTFTTGPAGGRSGILFGAGSAGPGTRSPRMTSSS